MAEIQIKRETAVELLKWCGWRKATEWEDEKLEERLGQVKNAVDPQAEEPEDAAVRKCLITILDSEEDDVFVVVDKIERKKPKKKDDGEHEVRRKTRYFYAGEALGELGLEGGVTREKINWIERNYPSRGGERQTYDVVVRALSVITAYLERLERKGDQKQEQEEQEED